MFGGLQLLASSVLSPTIVTSTTTKAKDDSFAPSHDHCTTTDLLAVDNSNNATMMQADGTGDIIEDVLALSPTNKSPSKTTGMNPQDDLLERSPSRVNSGDAVMRPRKNSNSHSSEPGAIPPSSPPPPPPPPSKAHISRRRNGDRRRRKRKHRTSSFKDAEKENDDNFSNAGPFDAFVGVCLRALCFGDKYVKSTITCMNVMARVVVWTSVIALAAAVVWYSYELTNNGTDPHLIAWFSAGAFVLLGFPLSMASIVGHLANYNQPHVQSYIVRILWMVPLYSSQSWLCLRFHEYAIYIETLRDCYESFVLYSFFQFLIEVLGGEEALILMLKDKSPTRGSHMWGMQWCIKPWLMGQPVRRSILTTSNSSFDEAKLSSAPRRRHQIKQHDSLKRVHWKSPFFVKCKFGVLQYVLLKIVCSLVVMILELNGVYKEGDFTPKGGYLYICFITNISQCWALYCLILFYYATHNELGPIRPVGKFLSVKALVFFTWWQSVGISILYQMEMIPHYHDTKENKQWSSEDVAKGIQDYLICVEMFFAAIVHTLVFPHSEYSPQAVRARARALNQLGGSPANFHRKRLGRHHQNYTHQVLNNYQLQRLSHKEDKSNHSDSIRSGERSFFDLEMTTLSSGGAGRDNPRIREDSNSQGRDRIMSNDSVDSDLSSGHPMSDWLATPESQYQAQEDMWDETGSKGQTDQQKPLLQSDSLQQHHVDPLRQWSQPPPSSLMQPDLRGGRNSTIDEGEEDGYLDEDDDQYDDDDEMNASGEFSTDGSLEDEETGVHVEQEAAPAKHNFVRAFLDSAIPRDLRDNTVGIVKGEYVVEKKTLLHHATTSDHYDLFSQTRKGKFRGRPSSLTSSSNNQTL